MQAPLESVATRVVVGSYASLTEIMVAVSAVASVLSRVLGRVWHLGYWLAVGVAAAYATIEVLREREIPDGAFWKMGPAAPYSTVITVSGLIAAALVAFDSWRNRRRVFVLERRNDLEASAQSLVLHFSVASGIHVRHLTSHVWVVSRLPWRRDTLRRLARFSLDPRVPMSQVEWKRGKGAIGRAWVEQLPYSVNLRSLQELHKSDPKGFPDKPEDDRLGLSDAEFRSSGHYWAVFAAPLRHERKGTLLGVATVESTEPNRYQRFQKAARSDAVGTDVTAVARLVRELDTSLVPKY